MVALARIAALLVGLFGLAFGLWFYTDTAAAAAAFFVGALFAAAAALGLDRCRCRDARAARLFAHEAGGAVVTAVAQRRAVAALGSA